MKFANYHRVIFALLTGTFGLPLVLGNAICSDGSGKSVTCTAADEKCSVSPSGKPTGCSATSACPSDSDVCNPTAGCCCKGERCNDLSEVSGDETKERFCSTATLSENEICRNRCYNANKTILVCSEESDSCLTDEKGKPVGCTPKSDCPAQESHAGSRAPKCEAMKGCCCKADNKPIPCNNMDTNFNLRAAWEAEDAKVGRGAIVGNQSARRGLDLSSGMFLFLMLAGQRNVKFD